MFYKPNLIPITQKSARGIMATPSPDDLPFLPFLPDLHCSIRHCCILGRCRAALMEPILPALALAAGTHLGDAGSLRGAGEAAVAATGRLGKEGGQAMNRTAAVLGHCTVRWEGEEAVGRGR